MQVVQAIHKLIHDPAYMTFIGEASLQVTEQVLAFKVLHYDA
jgi:hypothetical protein